MILAELGPGRGTLMADLLRAAARRPRIPPRRCGFTSSRPARYCGRSSSAALPPPRPTSRRVSPTASTRCRTVRCCSSPTSSSTRCRFGSSCAAGTAGPNASSRSITAPNPSERLILVEGPESPALALLVPPGLRDAPPGAVVEICPAAAALAASLGERLARLPGMALFIDYGYFPSRPGATLAALRRHRAASILDMPGEADLSAHVDFAAFAEAAAASGAVSHGPVPQRDFLLALGAEARHRALSRLADPARLAALESGLARLIDPAGMGNLFKVLALTSPGLPPPAGFARHPVDEDRATR